MGNPQESPVAVQRRFTATVRNGRSTTVYTIPAADTLAALIRLTTLVDLAGCRVSVGPV